MSEDPAPYFVTTDAEREIDELVKRMQAAHSPSLKAFWGRRLVEAKKKAGGYPELQGPLTVETVDALARHEAQSSVMNLEGERFDEDPR